MEETRGVFKRGDIWWYRVGRKIRQSSHSTDINEALAQRAISLSLLRRQECSEDWREWVTAQRANSGGWLRRTHGHMRRKTPRRGWEPCLHMEEFASLVLASNGRCALTGLDFVLSSEKRSAFAISVDRIDSSRGYCAGNVRVVLLAVNLAMSHWGDEALLRISRALVGRELLKPLHVALHAAIP